MSLSKYYKSSTSFQPEKIVKHVDTQSQGWESSVINTQSSSPSTNHSENDIPANEPLTEENVDATEKDSCTGSSTAPNASETVDQSQSQEVDSTRYIDISQAEERIDEAYQKGLLEGEEKAEKDYGTAVRALLSSCQQLDTVRDTLILNNRKEVLDFALAIAERILRISVQEQDSTIVATIEEALQRAVKSDEFTIYIHPDDYETVMGKESELTTGLSGLNNIVIKKDITIDQGGTKIESNNCTIDATIGSQYGVIREELKKKL